MNKQAVISFESPLGGRLVKFSPDTAGSVAGNLASAIVPVVMLAALARLVAVVAVPLNAPLNVVAVATPVITTPVWNVGAPVPALLVNKSALILPPAPANGVIPSVDKPRTSGIKSSPSATIKSAPFSRDTSAYCV